MVVRFIFSIVGDEGPLINGYVRRHTGNIAAACPRVNWLKHISRVCRPENPLAWARVTACS